MKKVIVVGAGIAGLATACRLSSKGHDVTIIEKNAFHGGKCSTITLDKYRFDRGPSLFTMPQYLEELFSDCGKQLSDYFEYVKHPTSCKYFWEDKVSLSADSEPISFVEQASKVLGVSKSLANNYFDKSYFKFKNTP